MEDVQQILPVTKAKRGLLELLKRMEEEESTIALTRNGEAVGILMTPRRYEALLETIEILGDEQLCKALTDSANDYLAGRICSHEEVWSD